MQIAFITPNYPSNSRPTSGTFVRQFVTAMARQGNDCSVINPVTLLDRRHGVLPSIKFIDDDGVDGFISVYRPRYLSYSSKNLGVTHTGCWSNATFRAASLNAIKKSKLRPDITYGHFMYPSGYTAIRAGKILKVPSVVGVGEGEFWTIEPVGFSRATLQLQDASAFLAVSNYIASELTSRLGIPSNKIKVFPNGVSLEVFCPTNNRVAICSALGLPSDTFNVGYVGPFIFQKGYPQLRDAVADIDDVRLILLGRGQLPPADQKIAFSGAVPHSEVSNYLGSCQIFVLPTLIEGSCNAVIEAMACGLPIVTSNGSYMDDIVDDDVAIRVDPTDVHAIREAILALKNNPELREKMSKACLRKAKQFDINERARRVTAWMEELIKSNL